MSILYDQLYASTSLVPQSPSDKTIQYTTMFQSANGQHPNKTFNHARKSSTAASLSSYSPKTSKKPGSTSRSHDEDYDDEKASMMTKSSSTSSTIALLLKEKLVINRNKTSTIKTPAQKQAERKVGRMDSVTLGTLAALKG